MATWDQAGLRWICACGASYPRSEAQCAACDTRRPERLRHKDGSVCAAPSSAECGRAHIVMPMTVEPRLTKDMAMAEARRALVERFGIDRGEYILAVLVGPEVLEAKRTMDSIAAAVAKNPRASAGAVLGAIVGAALTGLGGGGRR